MDDIMKHINQDMAKVMKDAERLVKDAERSAGQSSSSVTITRRWP